MSTALTLKAIRYGCDFRRADWRLYEEFSRCRNFPGELAPGECYLFVSSGENQLLWIMQQQYTENAQGWPLRFTDSRRWRFSGSTRWDPRKLRHYAGQAGIKLKGIGDFEVAFADQRVKMAELARERRLAKLAEAIAVKKGRRTA